MDRAPATARALALLAALTSPVFMAGAVVAWVLKLWPATPVTFAAAVVAVLGGPLLGLAHARAAREPRHVEPRPAPAPQRVPPRPKPVAPMTPDRARSLAFLAWRDHPPRYLLRLSRSRRRTVSAVRPEPRH